MKSDKKTIDKRNSLKVVTSNEFITACGIDNISLKARKLLYIAIAQCQKTDTEFYESEISVIDFAEMMNISATHVYEEADNITNELLGSFLKIQSIKKKNCFKKYSLFSICEYTENATLKFKLNKDMTDFLLKLNKNFTQPLLNDFLKMNSPYSMELWHLMQREMKSKKAYGNNEIEFELLLDEIRQVTGTQNKFIRLSDIKRYVIDKAIREIKDNCSVKIEYEYIKEARTVIGFKFKATSVHKLKENNKRQSKFIRKTELKAKQLDKTITLKELDELNTLILELDQMKIDEFM